MTPIEHKEDKFLQEGNQIQQRILNILKKTKISDLLIQKILPKIQQILLSVLNKNRPQKSSHAAKPEIISDVTKEESNVGGNIHHPNKNMWDVFNYKLEISEIPQDIAFEKTRIFYKLVAAFNMFYGARSTVSDILSTRKTFNKFYDFVLTYALVGDVSIGRKNVPIFVHQLSKLKNTYAHHVTELDEYFDEIKQKVFYPRKLFDSSVEVQLAEMKFMHAYYLMKERFFDKKREQPDLMGKEVEYFEHLIGTMNILLTEFPNPTMKELLSALLHDVIEDIPEFTLEIVAVLYGVGIAQVVKELTKIDLGKIGKEKRDNLKKYLDEQQIMQYKNGDMAEKKRLFALAKNDRDDECFGKLGNENYDHETLRVKLADRIHNLRTLIGLDLETKIKPKVYQTEKYFLDVAKKKAPYAYDSMIKEIDLLKQLYKFQ